MVTAPAAGAATIVSQATGRFLSGSAGGQSLDQLAALQPATAQNTGGPAVRSENPLTASALGGAVTVPLTGALQLPGGGVATFGAVNQVAQANPDGSSYGASGAVTNSGGISVGGATGGQQANATFNLAGLGGSSVANTFGNLRLSIGALAATATQAAGTNGAQVGRYQIGSLVLDLSSPALKSVYNTLNTATQPLAGSGLPALSGFTSFTSTDGAVSGSLATGALHVDLGKLVNLNALPPNTPLGHYLAVALGTDLPSAATAQLQAFTDQLASGINNQQVATVRAALTTLFNATVGPALSTAATQLSQSVGVPLADQLTALLNLIANVQQTSGGTFTEVALQANLGGGGAVLNLALASVGPSGALPGAGAATPLAAAAPPDQIKIDAGRAPAGPGSPLAVIGLAALVTGVLGWGALLAVLRAGRRADRSS
jgi:hypothetical protein